MLQSRIIPCLLIHNKGLVKTVKFKDAKYVGDPLNAVKIYNEKEADELIVLDIDASVEKNEPDYKLIERLALQCRMPLCYGGGIKSVEQALKIFSLGVEKIALSSAAIENPNLITQLADKVGKQSVVVVIDAKKKLLSSKYEVYMHNGKKSTGLNAVDWAKKAEDLGAGEIVINSIDNDGIMTGYDLNLIDKIREVTNIPLTVLGGAGCYEDFSNLIRKYQVLGLAAGSFFVFKGKYRAVLINYPNLEEKLSILKV
jgi:cyclase